MMPTVETKRLQLIPFSLELKKTVLRDKSRLSQMVEARIPEDWPGPDLMDALPFFIRLMEQDPSGTVWDGIILHKEDHTVIGDMGFKGGPDEARAVEIGYSIIPAYRNRGYATEMARGLITWAFQQPGITTVTAECLEDNVGSIKVLEKLGMRRLAPQDNLLKWEIRREDWNR
jgi:ribosomal-protein-alanine N-acetyltransferase